MVCESTAGNENSDAVTLVAVDFIVIIIRLLEIREHGKPNIGEDSELVPIVWRR
jgi:hypothetical protein